MDGRGLKYERVSGSSLHLGFDTSAAGPSLVAHSRAYLYAESSVSKDYKAQTRLGLSRCDAYH